MSTEYNSSPQSHTTLSGVPRVLVDDPYLASSLLHKSIRRGAGDWAAVAARALYYTRGRSIWRRLIVIAFEDIGIGSADALVEIVSMAATDSSRSNDTELSLVLDAVVSLVAAPKDRSSDYLICTATSRLSLEVVREHCGRSATAERLEIVHDKASPLEVRAVAAWYLSALNAPGEHRLDRGDRPGLLRSFVDRGVPETLAKAAGVAATKTREPIVLMVPLLWLEAARGPEPVLTVQTLPTSPTSHGVPLFALDKHTRAGKTAIARFVKENEAVKATLLDIAPPYRWAGIAGMAAYYLDAVPIAPQLVWHRSLELEEKGLQTDMEKVGVPYDRVSALLAVFRNNHGHLNEIRASTLAFVRGDR